MTALNATTVSPKHVTSKKVTRSAVAFAALAAGAVLALSGCSAGQLSQSAIEVPAVNGNLANIGQVALRDVRFLIPQSEGNAEVTNTKGGKAVLAFSAVNAGGSNPDELTSITSDLGTVKITPANPVLRPLQTLVAAGSGMASHDATSAAPTTTTGSSAAAQTPGAAADPEAAPILVEIDGLTRDVTPGLTYPVTFNFRDNGTVLVNVPVDSGPKTTRKPGTEAAKSER